MSKFLLHKFDDRVALGETLAARVCTALETGIEKNGKAVLAVSGGSTPGKFFEILSTKSIKWKNIIVTLVDERWVDETNARSNAALVKNTLLQNKAAKAEFFPLYNGHKNTDEALAELEAKLAKLPLPLSAAVLGMGTDGHTASFFPGADNLNAATSARTRHLVTSIRAQDAGEPRITLTLPVLVAADFLALHIEGEDKLQVLQRADKPGDANAMPIRHVLNARQNLEVFWTA